ncbi:MAG: ABC transporter substrate-binding protein, partial [Planctomycetota bacterium]
MRKISIALVLAGLVLVYFLTRDPNVDGAVSKGGDVSKGGGDPKSAGDTPPSPASAGTEDGSSGGASQNGASQNGASQNGDATTKAATNVRPLVVLEKADPRSLNPLYAIFHADSQIVSVVFEGLVRVEPDLSRTPALAESWSFSPDRKTLTFKLRKDVKWHDGVPFTAHDVAFTFDLHKDPKVGYSVASWKKSLESCEALDDYTVRFTYASTYPEQLIDATVGFPVPKHILESVPREKIREHEFSRSPIGTGAYKLVEWQPQAHVTLEANPDYFRGKPKIQRIVFKTVPEIQNRMQQLRNGEADVLTRVPLEHFLSLAKEESLTPYTVPDKVYHYIAWDLKNPLFSSQAVRRALTMAIDRNAIRKAVFGKHAEICTGPLWPALWGFHPNLPVPPFDVEEAKRALKAEGWADTDGDGILDKDG